MRRYRKRTLLLMVGSALAVPALLLSLLSIKLVRDFADIGQTVGREYGEYMATIAAGAVENAFLDREQVNMVAARFVPPEGPGEVIRFLNRFQEENPLYLLSFFVLPEGLVFYSDLAPERSTPYRPLPDWVTDRILATMLKQGEIPSGLQHLQADHPDAPLQITYFTVAGSGGRLLGVAGFIWDLEEVRTNRDFFTQTLDRMVFNNESLFRGAFFDSPVAITILDQKGKPFYSSSRTATDGYIAERPFERLLPFYRVGVQLRDDRFASRITTVVWTSSAMIGITFLAIIAALAFSLRFLLREIELAELKSTFVSNVSHELKTPLALIRLFAETLQLGRVESEEKEKEFLGIIGKESERLTHLINNVLDINRIEQGKKTYRMVPLDLAVLVRETLEAYKFSLSKEGFLVESEIEDDLPPVTADGDAVTQALINLMENAIKYSREERYLRVTLRRDGDNAVISVTDKGMGIPASAHERIFEKFFRVEKGLVHDVKGSGLGLSLVKHIADAHGGEVRVASRPGRGSTFTVAFPFHPPRSGEDRATAATTPEDDEPQTGR